MAQSPVPGGGGGPFAGGSGGAGQSITFIGATPLGHPLAPILANWLDNHMFVASALIGFTVMERYPAMKVVVAHGKASWMQEVLEKMEASTRVIPLLHHYPISTEPEEMWEHGNVMLGFDAEEQMIQKLPQDFAGKVVWGSRYVYASRIPSVATLFTFAYRHLHLRTVSAKLSRCQPGPTAVSPARQP